MSGCIWIGRGPREPTDAEFLDAVDGLARVFAGQDGDCCRLSVAQLRRLVALARVGLHAQEASA